MIPFVLAGSVGLVLAGPVGALLGGLAALVAPRLRPKRDDPGQTRLILLLLLVELRSGLSVLSSLQQVSKALPDHARLRRVSRVGTVSGLTAAIDHAPPDLRPVVAQLARAQRSGSSLAQTVRHLLERDLADERAERLARARSLPVRLMIPVTLLMLPGLVLMIYAPALLRLFDDLTGAWT